MTMLAAAAATFLLLHLLVAGTRLRDGIVGTIGEGSYAGLFSLASLAALVWMALAYNAAQAGTDDPVLWQTGRGVHDSGLLIVALAFFLGVQGLLMRNPTAVGMAGAASDPNAVHGVLRITRHPFLWGVALWSAFHLAANGDEASVILFGTLLALSVLGTISIDAKRRRKMGAEWDDFAKRTSNVPFAAILLGRTKLSLAELFGWRFLVAALLFAGVLFAHPWAFGVSPFPGGWRPY